MLARDPREANALNLLGVLHRQRGDLPGALRLIRRALALRPEAPVFLAALGGAAEDVAVDVDAFQAWFNRLFLGTALGTLGMYWAQVRQKSAELADRLPLYRATDD